MRIGLRNLTSKTVVLNPQTYQQQADGTDRVIAYASHTLSKCERNYPAHMLEFLVFKGVMTDHFHEYLYGGTFDVYTVDNLLAYILTLAKLAAISQLWVASLANYNFQLHYKTAEANMEADALSCMPWGREDFCNFGYLCYKNLYGWVSCNVAVFYHM